MRLARQRRPGGLESFGEVLYSPRSVVGGQVALGRALLLVCGLVVASTIWELHSTALALPVLAVTSVVLLGVVVLSPRLPWSTGQSRLSLVFPISVLAGLASVGLADHGAASAYTGLIVLCFVYVGLTQPPWTSIFLAPVAAGAWLACQDTWSALTGIRLTIAIIAWIVVGALLEHRSDREARERLILSDHAHTDSLTGLINRRALDDRLSEAVAGDTVVMCDLDYFKLLNDRDGHAAGDRVLADFGALLLAGLRGQDVAARYGGEEFVLLLTETSPEAALDVVARMRARWATTRPNVTFSSGIATITVTSPVRIALAEADVALYTSKNAGRNCDHISYQQIVRGTHEAAHS